MKMSDTAGTSGAAEESNEQSTASPLRRLGAVLFVDIAAISILLFGLLMFLPFEGPEILIRVVIVAVLVALVRIIGEIGWGSSPGKHLAGLRVVFHDRNGRPVAGIHRVVPAIIRNAWLWLPVTFAFFAVENIVSGLGVTVVIAVLLRRDGRTLTDRLSGARVISVGEDEKGAR
ncbi:RDD family protein [Corynebacterium sp. A21]|uniref:RDD family protein n=1 Tax=Corynebacterium sp. A21 TaxID=3457318 RepID=UPI003FD1BC06